ncbi:MAG: hypothetical protein WC755_09580 [Candidatus Woesearchaeota archaeon]|jgi:hypothetical protein
MYNLKRGLERLCVVSSFVFVLSSSEIFALGPLNKKDTLIMKSFYSELNEYAKDTTKNRIEETSNMSELDGLKTKYNMTDYGFNLFVITVAFETGLIKPDEYVGFRRKPKGYVESKKSYAVIVNDSVLNDRYDLLENARCAIKRANVSDFYTLSDSKIIEICNTAARSYYKKNSITSKRF